MITLALFAFAMFSCGNAVVSAQENQQSASDFALAQKLEADLDSLQRAQGKQQGSQKKSNRRKQADEVEVDSEQIEAWAEKHAGEWESWAEKFEQKMEKWAAGQEKQWESWADNYSEQWEGWAEKIESGEIKPEEIQQLVEKKLKMLKDMPLGDMIEGALKEGLGELENMPIESLGELHELVGGSLEQALKTMEKEISDTAGVEIKKAIGELETGEFKKAIELLQNSIQVQQRQIDGEAKEKIMQLKTLLKDKGNLNAKQRDEISSALEREIVDAITAGKNQLDEAMKAQRGQLKAQESARAMQAKAMKEVAEKMAGGRKKAMAAREMAEAKRAEALAKQAELMAKKATELANQKKAASAKARTKSNEGSDRDKKTIEAYLSEAENQQANLKEKDAAIEAMRREIRELRKEVERMKKSKN